jgi:shikimate dehydrogenase
MNSSSPEDTATVLLGLVGANIDASQSPRLHREAGRLTGLAVRYDLLVPDRLGLSFVETVEHARRGGYRGLNVTYPWKERAVDLVRVDDARVRHLGAVNTIVFDPDGPKGYNTDHSGFLAAYRAAFADRPPGRVTMVGAGGVGRAVAFGLAEAGLADLVLLETQVSRAEALAARLAEHWPRLSVRVTTDPADAARAAEGLVNCSPVGMVGHEGTPLGRELMRGARWAFDAVYTPRDTRFLRDAAAEGLEVLSGYELFFHQGIHAFGIFTGRRPDPTALREALAAGA